MIADERVDVDDGNIDHDNGQRRERNWRRLQLQQWPTSRAVTAATMADVEDREATPMADVNDRCGCDYGRHQRQIGATMADVDDVKNATMADFETKTHPDLPPVFSLHLQRLIFPPARSKVIATRSWRTGGKGAGHLAGV